MIRYPPNALRLRMEAWLSSVDPENHFVYKVGKYKDGTLYQYPLKESTGHRRVQATIKHDVVFGQEVEYTVFVDYGSQFITFRLSGQVAAEFGTHLARGNHTYP